MVFVFSMSLTHISAQAIWQVDSKIDLSVSKSGNYNLVKIKVKANNDDTQRSPKLIVTLPRNCKVKSITMDDEFKYITPYQVMGSGNLALSHIEEQTDGYVQFDLKNLNQEEFNVTINILPTSFGFKPKATLGAFIYGITPELNKTNNYKTILIN